MRFIAFLCLIATCILWQFNMICFVPSNFITLELGL